MEQLESLSRKREEVLQGLPPLGETIRGSLIERHLRCGKARCHCAAPRDKGHRVFYLSVSFAGGRTEQITVPVALVPVVRGWVENYQRWKDAVEEISAMNRLLLRRRLIEAPKAATRGKTKKRGGS